MTGTRTITARNPATDSENRIHADDVARRYGFRGGLVPGVTVYGYIATALAADSGWVAHGRTEALNLGTVAFARIGRWIVVVGVRMNAS